MLPLGCYWNVSDTLPSNCEIKIIASVSMKQISIAKLKFTFSSRIKNKIAPSKKKIAPSFATTIQQMAGKMSNISLLIILQQQNSK